MIGFLIALLSGALMSIQGVFNTQVTKTTGMWVGNGWVQFTAFAVCLAMWFFTGRDQVSQLMEVQPKYMLLGGVIGAYTTLPTTFIIRIKKKRSTFNSKNYLKAKE